MADTHTLYFEDIEAGRVFVSTGRTVTEADSTMFCMLSGDWNPLHCDEEFAKTTPFGKRVVGGIFGITLLTGMFTRWGVFELSALAMLSLDNWTFKAPILIGDTLHVRTRVLSMRESRSRPDAGIVEFEHTALNHRDEVVAVCKRSALMRKRP